MTQIPELPQMSAMTVLGCGVVMSLVGAYLCTERWKPWIRHLGCVTLVLGVALALAGVLRLVR
jgi:hypothetical protein